VLFYSALTINMLFIVIEWTLADENPF